MSFTCEHITKVYGGREVLKDVSLTLEPGKIYGLIGRKASLKALVDKMEELVVDPSVVFISHGDCGDEARALGEAIKAKFPVERLEINYVGPVIGNHSGPGTMALFFQGKHR